MSEPVTDAELESYLDEALSEGRMADVETALRDDEGLVRRLSAVAGRRDAGVHSLGAVWRRRRLSCPTREQLGSFLLGILDPAHADFVVFHVERVGCRYCSASLADLRAQHEAEEQTETVTRRKKYFQSSVGHLGSE